MNIGFKSESRSTIGQFLSLFSRSKVILIGILIICQQAILGWSIFELARIGEDFGSGMGVNVTALLTYTVLIALIYLPYYLSNYQVDQIKILAKRNYVSAFTKSIQSRGDLSLPQAIRGKKEI